MSRVRPVREILCRIAALLLAAQICGAGAVPLASAQEPAPQPASGQGFAGSFQAYAGGNTEARISDFSGLPVPRYSSLKFDKVNGRAGPSPDYPVEWTYARAGLPVVIVRESQDWRKIRDPQGDEVWVKKSQLAAERTAMTMADGAMRSQPDDRSKAIADYKTGAVMILGECRRGWCRVDAGDFRGWALKSQLWGADDLSNGG